MESHTTTTELAPENPPPQVNEPSAALSLDATKSEIAQIVSKPPSPMPVPTESSQSADAKGAQNPTEPNAQADTSKYSEYKDYKGNKFDPRMHRVRVDGSPELTKDGKLRLLPPSKRGKVGEAIEGVKRIFNKPPSQEELNEAEQASAKAQADAAAVRSKLEASAKRAADSYFATGTLLTGKGFLDNHKKRDPEIRALMMEYENATGKSFDLPPGLALAVGLATDAISQASNVEECSFKNGIFGKFKSGLENKAKQAGKQHAEDKLFGWLPWKKKKREADTSVDQTRGDPKAENKAEDSQTQNQQPEIVELVV